MLLDAPNTNNMAQRQFKFCVFRMILPKQENGFFPEREDLPLLEVTAEIGLWYRLYIVNQVCYK